jgi:hypothetical protein
VLGALVCLIKHPHQANLNWLELDTSAIDTNYFGNNKKPFLIIKLK